MANETGWSIAGNFPEFGIFDIKYGSTGKAAPGFQVEILDEEGNVIKNEKMGNGYKTSTSSRVQF